jgi:hypothetical protein
MYWKDRENHWNYTAPIPLLEFEIDPALTGGAEAELLAGVCYDESTKPWAVNDT